MEAEDTRLNKLSQLLNEINDLNRQLIRYGDLSTAKRRESQKYNDSAPVLSQQLFDESRVYHEKQLEIQAELDILHLRAAELSAERQETETRSKEGFWSTVADLCAGVFNRIF